MDDSKPRRPRIAGDIERTSFARRRTPVEGVPAVIERESSEAILISRHLDVLAERVEQIAGSLSTWVNEVVRHNERITALSTSIGSVVAYTDAAGRSQIKTDAKLERAGELLEGIAETLKDVVVRIGRLENSVERLTHNDASLEARLEASLRVQNALDVKLTAHEQRLNTLEQHGRDSLVRTDERRKILTWGRAALLGAGGAIAAVAREILG